MTLSPAQETLLRQIVASGHLPLQIRLLSGRRIGQALLCPAALVLAFGAAATTGVDHPLETLAALAGLVAFLLTLRPFATLGMKVGETLSLPREILLRALA